MWFGSFKDRWPINKSATIQSFDLNCCFERYHLQAAVFKQLNSMTVFSLFVGISERRNHFSSASLNVLLTAVALLLTSERASPLVH